MGVLALATREQPRVFALAVAGSVVYALATVASARVLGWATQHALVPAFRERRVIATALAGAIAAILAVGVVKVVGILGRRICAGIMQFRLQASYRHRVTRRYLRLPLSWHQRHPTGRLLSNANADVEAMWLPVAPFPLAVGVLVMLAAGVVAMLLTDVVLAVVGLCVFPAVGVLNLVYQRHVSPLAARAQQLRAEVSEVAHESFDGALVVRVLGQEESETARFAERSRELRDANVAVGRVRGLFDPVLEAIPQLGVLLVLLIGLARIQQGALQPGGLVEVAYLFTLLSFPVRALGWVLGDLPRSVVGAERVSGVLAASGGLAYGSAAPAASATPTTPTAPRAGRDGEVGAHLEVRGLHYAYPAGEAARDVLRGVDLTAAPGRTVAVVGPTGSGKSTLATLLVRLVDPTLGRVLLDETDVRDVRRGGLPSIAALVSQQTFLFDDDVRGNVTLDLDVRAGADAGDGPGHACGVTPEIGDDRVWGALRLAQADGFVAALPGGLDTKVGERGMSLSGGQRQRLALARALVRQPRLLVLDDATSSVDPRVEMRILEGLRDAELPSTVVLVAYRLSTIALADEVVYLDGGRVQDRGAHRELLARSERYAALVSAYERAGRQDAPPTGPLTRTVAESEA